MHLKEFQALLRRRFQIPKERPVRRLFQNLTLAERAVFNFFVVVFVFTGILLIWNVSSAYLQNVPILGGSLSEGVVGNPRFINPVLALSEADKNLTTLVYSGLVRIAPSGEVVNDLAQSIDISENHLTYTVTLNPQARFQDGSLVTADDIIFTIQKITDPVIKSPRRGNWEGIVAEKVDDRVVKFTLKKAYTPFIYNLTTGILPKHIWKNVTDDEFSFSQFNTLPIGSGPYQVESVARNAGGIPDYYKLTVFQEVLGQKPFIKNLIFRFYSSEEALIKAYNNGDIESVGGISPESISQLGTKNTNLLNSPLTRIFAVFFNQSQSKVLLDKSVRQALNLVVPKEQIITDVLGGYGTAIDGPLPAELSPIKTVVAATSTDKLLEAKKILTDNGWKLNEQGVLEKKSKTDTMTLSFSISTGDATELKAIANTLRDTWKQLGAEVEVLVYEPGELNQSVIRPRHFDALLFGEVVGREADLYPFWHSSQRNDPGLNIALYANSQADKLLEEARTATDRSDEMTTYASFEAELKKDVPAIFLYSPNYIYAVPKKVHSINLGSLAVSQDRFLGIRDWYIETDKVWKIFLD